MIQINTWLLAQRHNWERLGDNFSGRSAELDLGEIGWLLVAMASGLVLIWWLPSIARQLEGRSAQPKPARLFRELCRAHKLNGAERTLLKTLAEASGAENACMLFVCSDAFDTRHAPNDPAAVERLKEKLFAA